MPVASAAPVEGRAPACTLTISDTELRSKDGAKVLDDLVKRIRLAGGRALRNPKSIDDVRKILRRDTVYLFPAAAAFARSLDTKEGARARRRSSSSWVSRSSWRRRS